MHGLSGPIDGKTYPQVMVAMGSNNDQWIADIASYVRNSFGNTGTLATPADVARVRAATGDRETPWTVAELEASLPRPLVPDATWKVTASHDARPAPQANAEGGYNYLGNAAGALSFLGWTTGVPQQPGMWFQIELPAAGRLLTEIQFTSSTVGGRAGAAAGRDVPARLSGAGVGRWHDAGAPRSPKARASGHHRRSRSRRSARSSSASRRRQPSTTRRRGRCGSFVSTPLRGRRAEFSARPFGSTWPPVKRRSKIRCRFSAP